MPHGDPRSECQWHTQSALGRTSGRSEKVCVCVIVCDLRGESCDPSARNHAPRSQLVSLCCDQANGRILLPTVLYPLWFGHHLPAIFQHLTSSSGRLVNLCGRDPKIYLSPPGRDSSDHLRRWGAVT